MIGKGILNLAGGVLPRMSGGREAVEDVALKGVKGKAGQVLSVRLKMSEGVVDDEGEGGRGGVTKERIRCVPQATSQAPDGFVQTLKPKPETLTSQAADGFVQTLNPKP